MSDQTPSKPVSTCRTWSKRAASIKCGLKQALNKVENLFVGGSPGSTSPPRTLTPAAKYAPLNPFPVPATPPRTPTPAAKYAPLNPFPEPATPPRTPTPAAKYAPLNPFPEPATPPGRCARISGGQHDHEASGSNHTSNHTSEYFDAKDPSEYLQQHQILDYTEFNDARLRNRKQYGSEQGYEYAQQGIEHLQYGFERPHPGLEEQLAGDFGNILLNTPRASNASHPHPWDDLLNPVQDQQGQDYYYSGELRPEWLQPDDAIGSHATSMAQQQQTTMPGYGGMSVRTGETGDSRESLMDTAGTSTTTTYILPPVNEEKPSILPRPFNKLYVELRRIARGDEVSFASARMGRGMRVLGKAFCYTLRLRKTVMSVRLAKAKRKRILEPKIELRPQCMKRMRKGSPKQPMAPGESSQSTTKSRYKGITHRNGRWNAEIRVSLSKMKVWIGTFSSEREAALALDAGYYHCSEKCKKFNFPEFVNHLGPSQYQTVLALYKAERKDEATKLVKKLAADHAAAFGAP